MSCLRYVTHPEVQIEPALPVPKWRVSSRGRNRAQAMLHASPSDILIVGHGGVGTLWHCHLNALAIERRHDQPGQGHYFSVDLETRSRAPCMAAYRAEC